MCVCVSKKNGFSNPENKQKPGHKLPDDRKRRMEEKLEKKKIASLTAFLLEGPGSTVLSHTTHAQNTTVVNRKKKTSK